MKFLTLKVLNPEEELVSFPLNQSLFLEASSEVELASLEENITLIRGVKDSGTPVAADIYNSNIGHVKEVYSTIPIKITQEPLAGGKFKLICNPVEPLSPASVYFLFIDKKLSKDYISIDKIISKGPSYLELTKSDFDTENDVDTEYVLTVVSTPSITDTANIIKFQLYTNGEPTKIFTVNAKTVKNKIKFSGLEITVPDVAFGIEEEFGISLSTKRNSLENNFIVHIKTTISKNIKELENVDPSSSITYQDVIDFYKTQEQLGESSIGIDFSQPAWEKKEFSLQYISDDSFILLLNELTTDMIDIDNIKYRQLPAYNRTDLNCLGKYSSNTKFKLVPEVLDSKSILFTVEEE